MGSTVHGRNLRARRTRRLAPVATLQRLDDGRHPGAERSLDHDGVTRLDGGKHMRFELGRGLGIAALTAGGKSLPERAHQRTAAEYEVDPVREHGHGQLAMELCALRTELEHIAEDRDPPSAWPDVGLPEQ